MKRKCHRLSFAVKQATGFIPEPLYSEPLPFWERTLREYSVNYGDVVVRVFEAMDSFEVLDFNLYLSGYGIVR